jgi:hypothetical protein
MAAFCKLDKPSQGSHGQMPEGALIVRHGQLQRCHALRQPSALSGRKARIGFVSRFALHHFLEGFMQGERSSRRRANLVSASSDNMPCLASLPQLSRSGLDILLEMAPRRG